jgi:hypothetical protein
MIRLPFTRKTKDEARPSPATAFAAWCREEEERRRDSGEGFDEAAFRAAVDLAVSRLKAVEREGST